MTDLQVPREYDYAALEKARGRKRFAFRFLIPAVLVGTVFTTSVGLLSNYQPLVLGSLTTSKDPCTQEVGTFQPWDSQRFQVVEMTCDTNGDAVAWGFSVLNAGRIPITVLGFDTTTTPSILERATVSTAPLDNGRRLQPFAPFRLARGEQRWIEFRTRIVGCGPDEANASYRWFGARFRYRIGPMTRSDVFIGQQVVFGCAPPEGPGSFR